MKWVILTVKRLHVELVKSIIKKAGLKETVRNSWVYGVYYRSVGNPLYPFYALTWAVVKLFTIRKKVRINGIELILPVKNWITHFRWYLIDKKEVEVRDWVDSEVVSDGTLFDIGGNMALISMYAAKRHPDLEVYCFEPEYSNLALIKENLKFNKLMSRINVCALAFSNINGFSYLHIQDEEEGAAAHTESQSDIEKTDEGYDVVWKEGIAAYTLDHFCESNDIYPSSIKIDTDGNELKILQGAQKVLQNQKLKSIILEVPLEETEESKKCQDILIDQNFAKSSLSRGSNEAWIRA